MLNGNKSYLISFTALFSKKGYELVLGVDTHFDNTRDTQYHLSAPAYSTYRTLKMDVMKTATKSPYTATSLFGESLTESINVTEVEGVEMESVFVTVVSYLSDIQRHFSGESRLEVENISEFNEAESRQTAQEVGGDVRAEGHNKQVRLDITVQAENVLEAYREATVVAESLIQSEGYGEDLVLSDNIKNINAVTITDSVGDFVIYDGTSPYFSESVRRLNDDLPAVVEVMDGAAILSHDYDAEIEGLIGTVSFDYDAVISKHSEGLMPVVIGGSDIATYSKVRRTTDITDLYIDKDATSSYESDIYDACDIEHFRAGLDADGVSAIVSKADSAELSYRDDAVVVGLSHAKDNSNRLLAERPTTFYPAVSDSSSLLYVDWMEEGSVQSSSDVMVAGIEEGINEVQVDAKEDRTETAELVKTIISESPEVTKMARLFEIMYGHRAVELIKSGMEVLVDSVVSQIETADPGSITDTVIKELEKAFSGGTTEGVHTHIEHGVSTSFGKGVYHETETAERNIGIDAVAGSIGRALSNSSAFGERQDTETGSIITFGEGTLDFHETAFSENHNDVVLTDSETADNLREEEVVLTDTERAEHVNLPDSDISEETEVAVNITMFETSEQPSEAALWIRDLDADLKETGTAIRDMVYEGEHTNIEGGETLSRAIGKVEEDPVLGSMDEITIESIIDRDESATTGNNYDAVLDANEWADSIAIGEGKLDREVAYGSAENNHDAIIQNYSGMTGETVYEAVNPDHETAYIGDVNMISDSQEQVLGQLNGGDIETVIAEETQADAILVTEGADISDLTDSTRKKRVIPTDIEESGDGERPKLIHETVIEESEEGERVRGRLDTVIEESAEGERPKRVIETTIEEPSEGTHKTPTPPKKGRLWLIIGKIAAWSIWNWKKTR